MKRYDVYSASTVGVENSDGRWVEYIDMEKLLDYIAKYLGRLKGEGLSEKSEAIIDALDEAIHVARGGTFIEGGN